MFDKLKKGFQFVKKAVVASVVAVGAMIVSKVPDVYAAMSTADETAIKAGLTGSDAMFYSIGGALLVVCAGIWGFKRVKSLIGG